jgi:hypothetical protein
VFLNSFFPLKKEFIEFDLGIVYTVLRLLANSSAFSRQLRAECYTVRKSIFSCLTIFRVCRHWFLKEVIRVQLKQMTYFLELVRSRSFTKAAKALYIFPTLFKSVNTAARAGTGFQALLPLEPRGTVD